jgi:hypothetical protein
MKSLRKLDTYILERYPIVWHSKVVYLFFGGLLMWLAYFLIGYFITDIEFLKTEDINDYFFDSAAVGMHSFIFIIVLTIWALFFFKKNAIRHYYPLKKFYFTKLFVLIQLGLLPYASVHVPFHYGIALKTKQLVPLDQLKMNAKTANLALAFLSDKDSYDIYNRDFLLSKPLEIIQFDRNESTWTPTNNFLDKDSLSYDANKHPDRTIQIDGTDFQFLTYHRITYHTKCDDYYFDYVDSFLTMDSTFKRYSIYNYSNVRYSRLSYSRYDEYESNLKSTEYRNEYLPTVHRWLKNDEKDSIENAISNFKILLNRYNIVCFIDERFWVNYLSREQYVNFHSSLLNEDLENDYLKYIKQNYAEAKIDLANYIYHQNSFEPIFGYDIYQLDQISYNANMAFFEPFNSEVNFLLPLVLVFFFGLFFLIFDFAHFIQLVITIPIGGALIIIFGLTVSLIHEYNYTYGYRNQSFDVLLSTLLLITSAIVLLLAIFSVYNSFFSKRVSGILVNLGYVLAPFFPGFVIYFFEEHSKEFVLDFCTGESHLINSFWLDLLTPSVIFPLAFVASVSYFALIKKWYAKSE